MKRFAGIIAGLIVCSALAEAAEVGTTGGQTLRRLVSARPMGLGAAYTAVGGDIDAMFFNPAGVARITDAALTTSYEKGFAEQSVGSLGYAHPFPFGSVFVGGGYFDAGTIQLNQSDGTQGEVRAQQDAVGMAGVAIGRDVPFSIGLTGKFLRSELAEAASATVGAVDVGVQWKTPWTGLDFGIAVQNLGPDIKYEQEGDPLPHTVRAGIAYALDLVSLGWFKDFPYQFLVVADGVQVKEDETGFHGGLEVTRIFDMGGIDGAASLRGGYRSEAEAVDVGLGFVVANVVVDYAVGIISDIDLTHRFTIGYRFAPRKKTSLKFD